MNFEVVNIPSFNIIGIQVRTTNENSKSREDISALWQRFYKEKIQGQIPNKLDNDVIGLYIDYEKDFTKPYTMVIGCRVNSLGLIPEGMVGKTVPATKYTVFTVKGKLPDELINAWKYIWSANVERSYTGDFEVYGEKSLNRDNAEVQIFLSTK